MLLYLFCNKSHYENVPFEIPESWCWTTLGELCSIKGGKRLPKGKSFADTITPHIYIRVTDMKDHTVLLSSLKYIDEDVFAEIKNYTISSNDLYLTIAGTIGDVGLVPAELDGANLTENAAKLTDIKCSKQYLMYVLMSSIAQDHFCSRFHQVAQPKLSLETASSTLIPLPPYREQLRIAEELDRWLGVVVSVEDDLSELTNYVRKTKSKILDLAISGKLVPQDLDNEPAIELLKRINPGFEPCDNSHYENLPQGWTIVGLHSVAEIITGSTPSKLNAEYYNGDVPFYKPNDLDQGRHVRCASEYLSQQGKSISRSIPCNSIAVCCIGSIGKCGFIEKEGVTNQQINTIVPNDAIFPLYMYYFCNSSTFIDELKSLSSAVTISIVNKSKLSTIQIPLPPIAEQKRIISVIEKLYSHLDMITAEL